MSQNLRPSYDGGPVRSLAALEALLGADRSHLANISENRSRHYRAIELVKRSGAIRKCWDPSPEIRKIQKRLITQIFRRVSFPDYLHGSLPKRDYLSNAECHLGARWCACLDIRDFFPSISESAIRDTVWKGFFGMWDEPAQLLTSLTTLDGALPQGSLTASYLANLVIWRHESTLVERLRLRGFNYSRYVDDISVSSKTYPRPQDKTYAMSQVHATLRMNGLRQKRSKTQIFTRRRGIEIVGLHIGAEKAGRSSRFRHVVERAVIDYPGVAAALTTNEADALASALKGRIAEIARYHRREADHLLRMLESAITRDHGTSEAA